MIYTTHMVMGYRLEGYLLGEALPAKQLQSFVPAAGEHPSHWETYAKVFRVKPRGARLVQVFQENDCYRLIWEHHEPRLTAFEPFGAGWLS